MLGGFQIGRSALLTSQRAMQVTGQNLANAATIGYRRRTVELTSLGARNDVFSGQGVGISSIRRELDPALAARLRGALSMEVANGTEYTYLSQVEALQDALGDNNLSSELTAFFGAFSNLADNPSDDALRGLAVSRGTALADRVNRLHEDYLNARTNLDADLSASAGQIDQLLTDIATLNGEIVQSQDGDVSALQDQRDLKLDELAQLVEIDVIGQPAGSVTVQVNSIPVVLGNQSLGFEFERTDGGIELRTKDGTILNPTGGEIAALRRQDAETIQPALDALESLTNQLVFQVNRAHSSGQGTVGWEVAQGFSLGDRTVPLADLGLPVTPAPGGFSLHVLDPETGDRVTRTIGIDPSTMSVDDIVDAVNAAAGDLGVAASADDGGRLTLTAPTGRTLQFSDDPTGVLAAIGINSYFEGSVGDLAVRSALVDDPRLLAAGSNLEEGSNGTALLMAQLGDLDNDALGGRSLQDFWITHVDDVAVRTASARNALQASSIVRENLDLAMQQRSGVSMDEELLNLTTWQNQYQAAARFLETLDETMQELLRLA